MVNCARKLSFIILMIVPLFSEGQSFYAIKRPRNIAVYGGTGIASYKGELVNPKQIGKVRYNLVVGGEWIFSKHFTTKAELTWFRIAGSDANANDDRVERNLSFFSNNQELSLQGTFQIMPEPRQFYKRARINGYLFAGGALLHMNPKTEYNGKKYALAPLQTEGIKYSRFQFSIPYGVGIKIYLDVLHNIILEGGYRTTFTDHLDDVSIRRYPDPTTLIGGATGLSAKLSDRRRERDPNYPIKPGLGVRGNPKQNDGYFLFNIKYQYYLPIDFGPNSEKNKFYKKKRRGLRRR